MDPGLVVPELLLTVLIFLVFALDLFLPREQKQALGYLSAACLLLVAVVAALQAGLGDLYGGLYRVDTYTHFFRIFFPLTSFFVVLLSLDYVRQRLQYAGEYYGLLLMATLAMVVLVATLIIVGVYPKLLMPAINSGIAPLMALIEKVG